MSGDRNAESRAFGDYLQVLAELPRLPELQRSELNNADADANKLVTAARRAEREIKDAAAAAEDRLSSLRVRTQVLSKKAGVQESVEAIIPNVHGIEEINRLLAKLLTDVASAESAWSWVERSAPVANRRVAGPAASDVVPVPVPAAPANPARKVIRVAIIVGLLVVILCVVFAVVLLS